MIKESIKKRFQKMVKYYDELIEKCYDKRIEYIAVSNICVHIWTKSP